MGNEESRVVDLDTPTQTLRERSVQALAEYIKDGRAKQIVVMVGHSPSVSC
jgi:NAD-dependent histone deacetylase SIR2